MKITTTICKHIFGDWEHSQQALPLFNLQMDECFWPGWNADETRAWVGQRYSAQKAPASPGPIPGTQLSLLNFWQNLSTFLPVQKCLPHLGSHLHQNFFQKCRYGYVPGRIRDLWGETVIPTAEPIHLSLHSPNKQLKPVTLRKRDLSWRCGDVRVHQRVKLRGSGSLKGEQL